MRMKTGYCHLVQDTALSCKTYSHIMVNMIKIIRVEGNQARIKKGNCKGENSYLT